MLIMRIRPRKLIAAVSGKNFAASDGLRFGTKLRFTVKLYEAIITPKFLPSANQADNCMPKMVPRWSVRCKSCTRDFKHTDILESESSADYYSPMKPIIPPEGQELECSHCNSKAIYLWSDLHYESSNAVGGAGKA